VLEALTPWFFALDHTNYSRWLPVHIKDMKSLPPEVRYQLKRNWVFLKGKRPFSAMPLDQAYEQNNEKVKGSGGAIGLTENLQRTNTVRLQGSSHVLEKLQVQKSRSGVYRTVSMPW